MPKDSYGIKPTKLEPELNEEEGEDEKPPSIAGHNIGPTQSCRSSQESYVNVPSPAAIPPPSASGHISATRGKDQPGEESYVNVPSSAAIPPHSAPGHVNAQNRPMKSIIIPKNVAKTINRLDPVSSEEYESDDSDDNIYDDEFVVNNLSRTDTARLSQNDEAILGTNHRDDGKLPPSLPVKKRSVITKQPAGSGGINPERIETPDENEENDDDDNVYEDTEEIIRELQGIPPNRTHSNASSVMKSKCSVNQEEEEEQESFYGDPDGPVLPEEQRAKSSASLPSGIKEEAKIKDNKQDDTYEFIDVPPLNPHNTTSSKAKAKTLPSDLRTETEIPKVGSGINTVQRRKVETIGTELGERLAVLNMQKEWNQ